MKRLIILSLVCTLGVPAFLLAQQTDRAIITKADEFKKYKKFSELFQAYVDCSCKSEEYSVVRFSKYGEPEKYENTGDQFEDGLVAIIDKAETGDIYHFMNYRPLRCDSQLESRLPLKKLVIYIR